MCTTGGRTDSASNTYTEKNAPDHTYKSKHCAYLSENIDGSD